MIYDFLTAVIGLSFITAVVLFWQPSVIEKMGGQRWHGAVFIGVCFLATWVMPDYSQSVQGVRTPSTELVVRARPAAEADTAQETSAVQPGQKLHVVRDTAGWVGFREDAEDPTWTGYVPASKTMSWDAYQARQDSLRRVQARRDSIEAAREQRQAEQDAQRGMAWTMCKDFVRQRLKAPSTAEFPWRTEASISQDADGWDVRGYVDADNPMGARMRVDFVCEVRKDGDTWRLVDLTTDQR